MQDFLKQNGFRKDTTAPDGVNRWEKSTFETLLSSYFWCSITLNQDGTKTEYGIINFHAGDGSNYIEHSRKFTGVLNEDEILQVLDRNADTLPEIVRVFPMEL